MIDLLSNLLFPKKHICLICREKNSSAMDYICKDCYENLDILNREVKIDSPFINRAYYSLSYNRFIRDKMKDYKYNGKNYLCKPFGQIMLDTINKLEIDKNIDFVAYIPTHRRKEALRGYNQAELLANYISQKINKPLLQGNLIKIRWTKEQSHSNKIDRINNLKESFYIKDPSKIKGKRILLVDDIITTGSTMEECSRILKKNGAMEIVGLALTSSKTK